METILREFNEKFDSCVPYKVGTMNNCKGGGANCSHDLSDDIRKAKKELKSFISQAFTQQLDELKGKVEGMECPEKCRQGHIFEGYNDESETEENWSACPLCVKTNEYKPVVLTSDILTLIDSMK